MKKFMLPMIVSITLLCASLSSAFTVFYRTDGDALGRHRILLAIPNDATLTASNIDAGISAAEYDGSTQGGQEMFTCLHQWIDVRGTNRYYIANDGSIMERSDFVMPQGSLEALSPLCISNGGFLNQPVAIFTGSTP